MKIRNKLLSLILLIVLTLSACATPPAATVAPEAAPTSTSAVEPTPELPTASPTAIPTADPFYSGSEKLVSGSGSTEVTLRFINNTDKLLLINWVNFEGVEEPFTQVDSGSTIEQGTYSTHAWRVKDEAGTVIAEIVATKDKLQVFDIGPDLKVAYQPTPPLPPTMGPDLPVTERAYADRPDDFPGTYQVHVLYVLPADATDRNVDTDGNINISVQAANEWFSAQTGGTNIRFDTYQGELDITFVQLDMTSDEFYEKTVELYGSGSFTRDLLEQTLIRMNVFHPGKIYYSIFDIARVDNACADGAHPPQLMGRMVGHYPVAVMPDGFQCSTSEVFGVGNKGSDMTIPHEIAHVLGFASDCGKNPTSENNKSHTGDDIRDLMNAPDENDTVWWDFENMMLDPGNDDYYNHNIPGCADLADSAFLEPLPANSQLPEGWYDEWKLP